MWFFGWQHEVTPAFALRQSLLFGIGFSLLMATWLWFRRKQLKLTLGRFAPLHEPHAKTLATEIITNRESLMTRAHEKLNYVEFAARDLAATKAFFQAAFGWQFVDYGPDYCAFADEGLDGGFYKADLCSSTAQGGALLVFYSADIEATQAKVSQHGGTIIRPCSTSPVAVASTSSNPAAMNLRSGPSRPMPDDKGRPGAPLLYRPDFLTTTSPRSLHCCSCLNSVLRLLPCFRDRRRAY